MGIKRKKTSWNKGKKLSKKHRENLSKSHIGLMTGEKHPMFGKHHTKETIEKIKDARAKQIISEETKKKISLALKGNKNCLGNHLTEGHKKKLSLANKGQNNRLGSTITEEHKRIIGLASKGEKNVNWKGGVTPLNEKIRKSPTYKEWRKAVFERDNYTCQMCGKKGGKLHAHHIRLFSEYPELRFEVNNGLTLCKNPCHKTKGLHKKINKLKEIA
jgi:rubrerythrin